MPVRARALGAQLHSDPVEVTPRRILAYAAGIGQTSQRTFDDVSDIVAAPSFCVALEWPVISNARRGELLGLSVEETGRVVHVEQDSQFHRMIRPGDRLRTHASIAAIRATSAGAFVGMRLVTVDARDEAPVTTTWYGAIYRQVGVDGEDGATEDAPSWPADAGSFDHRIEIAVSREAAHVYTECSGIWNPIHTERRAALAVGLTDIILHGTATWALAGRELVRVYANSDPARLQRLRARFARPVIPGNSIALLHRALSSQHVHFIVRNADGTDAVVEGRAIFAQERS
jgi:acyl dehydratase